MRIAKHTYGTTMEARMRKLSFLAALAAILIMVIAPVGAQDSDIVDIAVEDGRFTTLVAAVQAAGLVDTLKSEGPFTVSRRQTMPLPPCRKARSKGCSVTSQR